MLFTIIKKNRYSIYIGIPKTIEYPKNKSGYPLSHRYPIRLHPVSSNYNLLRGVLTISCPVGTHNWRTPVVRYTTLSFQAGLELVSKSTTLSLAGYFSCMIHWSSRIQTYYEIPFSNFPQILVFYHFHFLSYNKISETHSQAINHTKPHKARRDAFNQRPKPLPLLFPPIRKAKTLSQFILSDHL